MEQGFPAPEPATLRTDVAKAFSSGPVFKIGSDGNLYVAESFLQKPDCEPFACMRNEDKVPDTFEEFLTLLSNGDDK